MKTAENQSDMQEFNVYNVSIFRLPDVTSPYPARTEGDSPLPPV